MGANNMHAVYRICLVWRKPQARGPADRKPWSRKPWRQISGYAKRFPFLSFCLPNAGSEEKIKKYDGAKSFVKHLACRKKSAWYPRVPGSRGRQGVFVSMLCRIIFSGILFDAGTSQAAAMHLDLDIDTDRNGSITQADDKNEALPVLYTHSQGALILPNLDDDDGKTQQKVLSPDAKDAVINGPQDIADLGTLRLQPMGLGKGHKLPDDVQIIFTLTLPTDDPSPHLSVQRRVRVFSKREPDGIAMLGPKAGARCVFRKSNPEHAAFFEALPTGHDLGIEGIEPGVGATITVTVEQDKKKIASDSVSVLVTPILLTNVMDEPSRVLASEWVRSGLLWVEGLDHVLTQAQAGFLEHFRPDHLELVELTMGQFMQDPLEVGFTALQETHGRFTWTMHVLIGIRHRKFYPDTYATQFLEDGIGYYHLANPKATPHMGGNLDSTPAFQGYPYGLALVGSTVSDEFRTFIKQQGMQLKDKQLLEVDLPHYGDARYGTMHVDEMVSFVPSDKRFKVLVADFALAQKILDTNRKTEVLHQHLVPLKDLLRFYVDLGDDDSAARQEYNDLSAQAEKIKTQLQALFGKKNVIPVPVLPVMSAYKAAGKTSQAGLPNPINLQAIQGKIYMPDPFYEPFRHYIREQVSPDVIFVNTIHFWNHGGGAHCGTNVFRVKKAVGR